MIAGTAHPTLTILDRSIDGLKHIGIIDFVRF